MENKAENNVIIRSEETDSEIIYKFSIMNSRIHRGEYYCLRFFKFYFNDEEKAFINELMMSCDVNNFKLAKAIIDNKNG